MAGDPIDGQVLQLTAAKASVPASRLPDLVRIAGIELAASLERYRREYERVHDGVDREVFLVESGHWERLGDRLEFDRREREAVRRAHEEQFRRIGRRADRAEEFETALEIRECVVIGTG